ncbi:MULTISPECIES: winged helix-turn-helix transcriptional regulator [Leuconostoc]|uniref:Transcriptional regulator, HxlR family n=2 Tax=Leuconostoc TaxID=1243 RepID=A0AAN2QSH0_9LACO|nr:MULTISPECIES: helix-turn-helix domain-containing protein [Leuconostoc]MBZ5947134.1 helix-turn-helix transcriptional regulator [Leuconostoc gasicomitatum]MBZ5955017.1 helix-turn-helix transcriptional regulator [Leuconostoc gasicomitatum]MBZ5956195.1 helix-turn-helix transcriptional regulator [Leuconostoc gasicomitatum]MBZ5959395.1 helix-turn-helix transcriptional regulator [Leuconostoc gasicomitatum]MBZ5960008.1 helix-turn-helix transcriptional regulator [Leuconostoc gasicomitatum]
MEPGNETIITKSICPARKALNVLKGKFTLEILSEIIDGNLHYGSLLRSIDGMNPRILAQRLHEFEKIGVLSRKVIPTNPPQVEYRMTEKGTSLRKIAKEMKSWGEKFEE